MTDQLRSMPINDNNGNPIAVHVLAGEWTTDQVQALADSEDLPVRDMREISNRFPEVYPSGVAKFFKMAGF